MNNQTQTPFDLKATPLTGSNLLNASAGTGKTYSLAYLYLRLLLEKGLQIEEILVTTFTVAATAELKARIFTTIQQAERAFDAIIGNTTLPEDEFLVSLLNDTRHLIQDDKLLQQRLRLALAQFDYAQVYTINGFALQLLRENTDVLDSYNPEDILNDDSDFIKQAYLTLARDNFSLFGDEAAAIGKAVSTYNSTDLIGLLSKMLEYHGYIEKYMPSLFSEAESLKQRISRATAQDHHSAIKLIAEAIETKQLNGRSYSLNKLENFAPLLTESKAYFDETLLTFFAQSNLQNKRNKNATATFDHDFFRLCDELLAEVDSLPLAGNIATYRALLLLTEKLSDLVAALKAEQMALTHNDIVQRVANGGDNINTRLKAALIDEAQDTNAEQMALFRQLFLDHNDDKIVFFVGDPKQAIYGFRGANIYSYLDIENDVDHRYIMETNYRSSESLNASVNAFFSGMNPFVNEKVNYAPIHWNRPNSDSPFGDKSLTFVTAEGSKTEDLAYTAAQTLLAFIEQYGIAPRDIAVLVRTGSQAKQVKTALANHGLSASYTGKFSIYETDEAKLLLALLNVIHSGNSRLTKSLMLTPLLGYSLADVADSETVTALNAGLHRYAKDYAERGFGTMFYRVMNQFAIAGRLLQSDDGKRRLTNFVQLFELLQSALQKQSLSLAGLCDRLSKSIHEADKEAELRLEDDQAISIMTIHSSKGLEFPVVCLPFFEYERANAKSDGLFVSHRQGIAAPSFLKPQQLINETKREESEESRRLAYVALTRAKFHNIIVRQPLDSNLNKKTAMLPELLGTLDNPQALLQGDFVAEIPALPLASHNTTSNTACTYRAKTLRKPLYSAWQLESFSRLQQQVSECHDKPATSPTATPQSHTIITGALMDYPSGARPGTALHEVYEHYMQYRQNDAAFHTAIDTAIERHLLTEDKTARPKTERLADAIADTAAIALSPHAFALKDIATNQQSIEMKFFMHLSPEARQHLLQTFGIAAQDAAIIPTEGYVHGYIDYCFQHNGLFYVLDYKSNRLGETYDDYNHEGMHAEMLHHRYDLQALIYTLALCKHLSINNEAEYHAKIGGVYYLFVRGMVAGKATGIYHDKIAWESLAPFLATATTNTGEREEE